MDNNVDIDIDTDTDDTDINSIESFKFQPLKSSLVPRIYRTTPYDPPDINIDTAEQYRYVPYKTPISITPYDDTTTATPIVNVDLDVVYTQDKFDLLSERATEIERNILILVKSVDTLRSIVDKHTTSSDT